MNNPLIVRLKLLFVFENKQSLNSVLGGSIFVMQFSLSGIYICASQSRDQYFAHERLMCIRCQCDGILLTYVQDIMLGSMP